MSSVLKRSSLPESSLRLAKKPALVGEKRVYFNQEEPTVYYFDPSNGHDASDDNKCSTNDQAGDVRLTEELTVLSTLHGRARRELRDISKHDLKTVMKYGTKKRGNTVNGEKRWMFELDNTVFITDDSCRKEITCYKKAVSIEPASITNEMMRNHEDVARVLREEPHMCTTHSIIIIDQSGSMRTNDVDCFRSRSDAAYGTLALDYIAEQLYQMGDEFFVDAVTIIEMNDSGSIFLEKEPLDWILFNKVLLHMSSAKPKSHGNYAESLELAVEIIQSDLAALNDLDADDIPAFMLVLVSDGKPSDKLPEHEVRRKHAISCLAQKLKSKLTVFGMGIGASGSDFEQLQLLVDTAKENGAEGQFNHAGLSPASLSASFSSVATSMTTTRDGLFSTKDVKQTKTEKSYTMRQKNSERTNRIVPTWREIDSVSRWLYDGDTSRSSPWRRVEFFNRDCVGFEMEKNPFGKGKERLAHMFHEIKNKPSGLGWEKVDESMVAKESKYIEDERSKEKFHLVFCHVQHKANEWAKKFNKAITEAPMLRPSEDEVSKPPPITFLKCSIYEYTSCGNISHPDNAYRIDIAKVEKYLRGKYTKFNSNNGFVLNNRDSDGASIELVTGEVLLNDFVQAFSHWVYEHTYRKMIACDLQGVLDMEGRRPIFRLTDPAICSRRKENECFGKTDLGMKRDSKVLLQSYL
ncbi:hypothetical protein ACHAW5_008654 [Stephanodiscus triporus]|uniref:Alpha-type protein kinase domain-containing protein n=1 Tax=Stephanodiscus triporus TaxID=2934178 RepID=A0ABD3MVY7_9STRA